MQVEYKLEKSDGGYIASVPSMPPVTLYGKSEEELIKKLGIAIKMYVTRHPELSNTRFLEVDIK